ncbi:hypothetical protein [Burkholderia ubonensis]|uniref:hypothetical protein n=1 Tax=Burkholderia ubonensis TaxID=101571 RepID=UPI0008FEAA82|nr:hypothetical protein [Burkholderia ubonensis]OJB29239.1 hypothetical protein BGV48_03495 [Burkholderia ubonensis]
MKPISINTILAAVEILGAQERVDDEIEKRVRALVEDDMTMRRLVDIIPEAFGLVVASHLPSASASGMTLPDTFSVQDESGAWRSVPITREPVFVAALEIAQHIFHSGPRHVLRNNAERSSIFAAVSKALDSGDSLEGSTLGGPAFLGLSLSLYS